MDVLQSMGEMGSMDMKNDHSVASQSLRSQIQMLRPHASVFIWSNASDGMPPEQIARITIKS
jgi:beta-galactosidase/beta-glucuronidase